MYERYKREMMKMITYKNLYDNKNIEIIAAKGGVKVLEYKKDLSVNT